MKPAEAVTTAASPSDEAFTGVEAERGEENILVYGEYWVII